MALSASWMLVVQAGCKTRNDTPALSPKQELEVVTGVRESLTRILEDARDQMKTNQEMKKQLEFDWSDKVCTRAYFSPFSFLLFFRMNI